MSCHKILSNKHVAKVEIIDALTGQTTERVTNGTSLSTVTGLGAAGFPSAELVLQ